MIKQIAEAVASWLKYYQEADIMPLIDHARERIENNKRGEITNDMWPVYDSRLQQPVQFTNWKAKQQYYNWIKRRPAGSKHHKTYSQWLKER